MTPTFRQLDANAREDERAASSSLGQWYNRVRDIPLDKLSVGDLCRACRQELFLVQVLPCALRLLKKEPIAGELFDGELASTIARISKSFWKENPVLKAEAKDMLQNALPSLDSDVRAEANAFILLMDDHA
jgi:hypothetical protein